MSGKQNEWTDVQKKAFEIITSGLDIQENQGAYDISPDSELTAIGIDSTKFINMVVALENEFGFEFDDENLLVSKFPTIKSIIDYVESKAVHL
ncbi:MAG: acyl carrier protein [Clostridiales bacterium]|nr:acyl carrier protein [Clostridiales bacterium]